jgi:LCP family protein required for cell wall assembly
MLSIPRDLYVNVPGYAQQRINAAYVLGELEGAGRGNMLAIQTVEENLGVAVQRTVRVNFQGFVAIIDAAGGVTINVETPIIDYEYPTPDYGTMVVAFDAGEQHMDGERALQYARIRHGSTDMARSRRQQQVIQAFIQQIISPVNWLRLPSIYRAFVAHVETDLILLDVLRLGPAVLWVGPDHIDHRVFDDSMATSATTGSGASVLEPNWPAIEEAVSEMFYP